MRHLSFGSDVSDVGYDGCDSGSDLVIWDRLFLILNRMLIMLGRILANLMFFLIG